MTITFSSLVMMIVLGIWSVGLVVTSYTLGALTMVRRKKEAIAELKARVEEYDTMCDSYLGQLEEAKIEGFISDEED